MGKNIKRSKWFLLAILLCGGHLFLMGAYRSIALGEKAEITWDKINSRISFTIDNVEVAHMSTTTFTMVDGSGKVVADGGQFDNLANEAGSGAPSQTHGIVIAVNKDLKLSGTGALCTDHVKDAAEVANMDLSGADVTAKGNVTLDHATGVLKADSAYVDKIEDEAGTGAPTVQHSLNITGNVDASGTVYGDNGYFDNLANEAGAAAPSATFGVIAAVNQDIAVSGTGAFKGSHIEDAAGVAAIDLSGANVTGKVNFTLDAAAGILQADKVYTDNLANEAGAAAPTATFGVIAAVNQDFAASGTGAFKGDHLEDATGVAAADLSGADITAKGNVTLDHATGVLKADSVYTDNLEDEAGTGAPMVQHGINVTGNVDASGTVYGDNGYFDNLANEAGTAAPSATFGLTAAVNQDFACSGTGALKSDHLEDAAGVAAADLSGANITAKGNVTLDHATGILKADSAYVDKIEDEAGTGAPTVQHSLNVTGNVDASGTVYGDNGYFDNLANEAGAAAPSATFGLTAAVDQDIACSGTGAFKGNHVEDAGGVAAIDMSGADVTLKGDIEVATGAAYISDTALTHVGSPHTLTTDNYLVTVDASGGAVVLKFPVTDGYTYHVKATGNPGANSITLQGITGTIDGAATNATKIVNQWDHTSIIADGTNLLLK
jgi:hypothetical protein